MTRQEYNDYEARVNAFFEREGINCLSTISDNALGEVYKYFSWTRCACCARTEGGNRYECAGYNPTTRLTQGGYSVCTDCVYYAEYGQLDDMTMLEVSRDDERLAAEDSDRIRQMTDAYIECALWSSTDDDGEPLDRTYGAHNICDTDRMRMRSDCLKFYQANKADLELYADARHYDSDVWNAWSESGHCFWLSRNGHGTGFFDRFDHRDTDEARALGDRLQAAARAEGEAHLLADDGELFYYNS